MASDWFRAGDPAKFEIALRWVENDEPSRRWPAGHGWSMGDIEINVAGIPLTGSARNGERRTFVRWYLSPVLDWFAENWATLLHEERFSWPEKSAAPAAIACRRSLRWIADPHRAETASNAQSWYKRHGLRSAAAGGIFPDLFIRRLADDIELSWSGREAEYSPPGFRFESGAGQARLPVTVVGTAIARALEWAAEHPPRSSASYQANIAALRERVRGLHELTAVSVERTSLPMPLVDRARAAFSEIERLDLFDDGEFDQDVPCIDEFSPAVAMFGGVAPDLGIDDIALLRDALVRACDGEDSSELAALVASRSEEPLGDPPYADGERFAAELLEDLGIADPQHWVDVEKICERLEVGIEPLELETDTIRGVAFAGIGFLPRIVVNGKHPYNQNEAGRRFTIAHELCHVLFDRTRAKRIAHASGPWAAAGIEKRANAFAAYLLMPPSLIHALLSTGITDLNQIADSLHVNESPLIDHLYNLDLIEHEERIRLKGDIRRLRTSSTSSGQ